MLLVQVPISSNYESPLNFVLLWVATSHRLFNLWLQSMSLAWNSISKFPNHISKSYLNHSGYMLLCLGALYLLSKFLTKGYTEKVLKKWRLLAGNWGPRILLWPFLSLIILQSASAGVNNRHYNNDFLSPQAATHNLLKFKSYSLSSLVP